MRQIYLDRKITFLHISIVPLPVSTTTGAVRAACHCETGGVLIALLQRALSLAFSRK